MKQVCCLVLGMHRSGTSALSGVLETIGIDFGNNLLSSAEDNKKGFFEDKEIVRLNDEILNYYNTYWDDISIFEPELSEAKNFINQISKIIKKKYRNKDFGLKDPRISLLLPLYINALHSLDIELKIIVIYRNPFEVAKSLEKRNNFSQSKSLLLWLKYNLLLEKYSRKQKRISISFSSLNDSYYDVLDKVKKFLNIDISPKEVFIEKNLKNHNLEKDSLTDFYFLKKVYYSFENLKECKKTLNDIYLYMKDAFYLFDQKEKEEQHLALIKITERFNHSEMVLNEIYSSKSWKVISLYRKLKGKCRKLIKLFNFSVGKGKYPLPDTIIKMSENKNLGSKVCLFAHYDNNEQIKDYVLFYLSKIKEIGFDIIFISTAPISDKVSYKKLNQLCNVVIHRDNIGYDFGSWAEGIKYLKNKNILLEKLLVANDSVYGPLYSLENIINSFEKSSADFYGLTDSYEFEYHIQSYFMIFNKDVLRSEVWKNFWEKIYVHSVKEEIVRNYEVGLSTLLMNRGFKMGVYLESHNIAHDAILENHFYKTELLENRKYNITHLLWDFIITKYKYPFIKKELIQKNPLKLKNLDNLENIINNLNYDKTLIK